ncbi:MAG: TatD family hydrolase [Alphaproteobacteria bacterium]|nr:TatD family hydrolase [Alphaproteobacteria bacterium]
MQFIDTHIHLQDFNLDCALKLINSDNVKKLLVVCAKACDFEKAIDFANNYRDKIIVGLGVHPWYLEDDSDIEKLEEFLIKYDKALVGEIGVDGLRGETTLLQHEMFSKQLELAKRFNRTAVVHGAKALDELKKHEDELKDVRFVHHGFAKNEDVIKFVNKCDGWFGLGAVFLKTKNAKELFDLLPKDRILFETDAPYRVDEQNYVEMAINNINQLSEISKINVKELEDMLIYNAERFLDGK